MNPAVTRFFDHRLVLPNLPVVALQLMRSFNDDRVSLDSLAAQIGKDPALAAKVLRLANSARYSPLRSISSLRDAGAALGMTNLRKLTILSTIAGNGEQITGIDRLRYWRHAMATASIARQLATLCMVDADAAYLAGLMLRTGQLLMLQADQAGVLEVERACMAPGQRPGLERARWQCCHADITAELARRWQFPDPLCAAFDAAGDPLASEPFSQTGAVLHLAAGLADAIDLNLPPIEAVEAAMPALIARLRLKTSWLSDKLPDPAELAEDAQMMTSR
jgi:HD-like signal output (HDOD) protein